MKRRWFVLLLLSFGNYGVFAENFQCPGELSLDQLKDVVARARQSRNDLPAPYTGSFRIAWDRDGTFGCTYHYQEIRLPASDLASRSFYIDSLGELFSWTETDGDLFVDPPGNYILPEEGEVNIAQP